MTTHSDLRKQIDNLVPAEATGLFVGGQWRDASGGGHFAVTDPSDGETLREVADAAEEDGVAALDAAVAVQSDWAATPPRERSDILRRAFEQRRHAQPVATHRLNPRPDKAVEYKTGKRHRWR